MKELNIKTILENEKEKMNYVNLTHEFKTMCTCDRAFQIREGIYSNPAIQELADKMVGEWLFNERAICNRENKTTTLEIDEHRTIVIVYETIVGISSRAINAYWYVIES